MTIITDRTPPAPSESVLESIGGFEGNGVQGSDESLFPIECIPSIAGEMAREAARVSTCRNEPLAATAVLGVLSAAIGASLEVESGPSRRTRGNLFLLAVAESGTGKTEIFKHISEPLDALEAEALSHWRDTVEPGLHARATVCKARIDKLTRLAGNAVDQATKERHCDDLRAIETERMEIQRRLSSPPQSRVSDITKEKLAELMHGRPGEAMASMSSEARGIVSILEGRYSTGGDGDFYCAGYSGDSVQVDRVKNQGRIDLRNPCLSILWMMQGDIVRKAFATRAMNESGFLPRFITFDSHAQPHESNGDTSPIPESTKEGWRHRVKQLADLRNTGENKVITVSASARDTFLDYQNETIRRRKIGGDLASFGPFVARWSENAWRLGVVLHAAEHGDESARVELSQNTAESAVRLMRWFATKQIEILLETSRQQGRARLDALMRTLASKGGKLTMNMLAKNHGFRDSEVYHLNIMFPGYMGITRIQSPDGGRPSTMVSLTPNPPNNPETSCLPRETQRQDSPCEPR